ncbi:ADR199Cp [Eremothecium gossypii ATCC 10895]|uniref:ADR199Cp n=1 Tax=Eremothecium gossypii (strain ATCC 10895 / CBS 109.51 / FGSC 9923 / NRRL Y-1056) TaxID=284811 RepID=Q759S4_EREGS|nr:ADR199Cp [Eremothecium gossypii ATCC 10895]AAS52119.2 ADR199Cp [Eremothecium gossypii ATCC 10895]AEY96418.1 FADR199Cp [Eremothecium gossypii FDAG1]
MGEEEPNPSVEEWTQSSNAGSGRKWRRIYKACLNCRTRKVRCDLGPVDKPREPPCVRCSRERKECIFTELRRGRNRRIRVAKNDRAGHAEPDGGICVANAHGDPSSATGRFSGEPTALSAGSDPSPDSASNRGRDDQSSNSDEPEFSERPELSLSSEFTTLHNTLEFLTKAAGSVAKDNGRLLSSSTAVGKHSAAICESITLQLYNPLHNGQYASVVSGPRNPEAITDQAAASRTPQEEPESTKYPLLRNIEYVGPNNTLTVEEVIRLTELFFVTHYPFFPHIPLHMQDPEELARYPILLCGVLSISARYHKFEDIGLSNRGSPTRNIDVHEYLWRYCQQMISQTVWTEASTRSIGTVLVFLIFTEWNPRAIHRKCNDYANATDRQNEQSHSEKANTAHCGSGIPATERNGPRRFVLADQGSSGLSAMRRSKRMAWMLVGNAVRLAQDMDFINTSSKIFVATHTSETNCAMNMGQNSTLSHSLMNANIIGSESSTAISNPPMPSETEERYKSVLQRLGKHVPRGRGLSQLYNEFLEDERILYGLGGGSEYVEAYCDSLDQTKNNVSIETAYESSLLERGGQQVFLSFAQRAKIELLRIMSVGYETIYSNHAKLVLREKHHILSVLGLLSPQIENWYTQYNSLLVPAGGAPFNPTADFSRINPLDLVRRIDAESIICDYYYCQLYIYSLALTVDFRKPRHPNASWLDRLMKSARYVELAYNAAREVLRSAIRVHRIRMLKYMPTRWVERIVGAVAFIVKCYLTMAAHLTASHEASAILTLSAIPPDEVVNTIQRAAITLREASPDDVHLCNKYSTILMYLCSEMKLRNWPTPTPPLPRSVSGEPIRVPVFECSATPAARIFSPPHHPAESQTTGGTDPPPLPDHTLAAPSSDPAPLDTTSHLPWELIDWLHTSDEIGLDFVEPWTDVIERLMESGPDNIDTNSLY